MSRFPPFAARTLAAHDRAEAMALAKGQGAHGLYVQNALAVAEGEVLALYGRDALLGLCWFGPRGNLIALLRESLDPPQVVAAVAASALPWRIALGPCELVDALRRRVGDVLVHRDQVYYVAASSAAPPQFVRDDVRVPTRADREALMQATLLLNEQDLHVEPKRVDRTWLRDNVEHRIAEGSTRVLGAEGSVDCKLDIGSRGPAGVMLEGVFTFPAARGRGLATGLVATCIAAAAVDTVCLHVAADNAPARAVYERAGMRAATTVRLLLLA
jgi:GNAT superfamily N-acetyltransferase